MALIIKSILASILVGAALCSKSIHSNRNGFLLRFNKVVDVLQPGLHFMYPFDTIDEVTTGFDTDWTTDLYCFSQDNVKLTIKNAFVQNEYACHPLDKKCFMDIYIKYHMTDAKAKAKSAKQYVPEDGIIFKYIPEVLAKHCQTLKAYETRTDKWSKLFPEILKDLEKVVDKNIKLTGYRMDIPTFDNPSGRLSYLGIVESHIYTWAVWMLV